MLDWMERSEFAIQVSLTDKGVLVLQHGSVDAQYHSARVLRHVAMSGAVPDKAAVFEAIPTLVNGLQVRSPHLVSHPTLSRPHFQIIVDW